MKKIFFSRSGLALMSLFLVMLYTSSCGTSNGASSRAARDPNLVQPADSQSNSETWYTLLNRVAGVDVRGAEPNLSIRIRGDKSIELSNEPLFVLDGVQLGQEFSRLASAILPKDVASIRVVKGSGATMYGAGSGNGVIVVTSKE
ncbi:MAG: TonB-dependent receptor plug domain-containing protein [Saprospiraceae bacterium]|nr:TonB-dependent receptor plug domain-containing protein [Lewinella sp.]